MQCRCHKRLGAAVTELAVLSPILVMVALATIDVCNFIHLRQQLNCIAFEACRNATRPTGDFASGANWGQEIAQARGLRNCQIRVASMEPSKFPTRESLPLGTPVETLVSAPTSGNIPGPFLLFRNANAVSQRVRIAACEAIDSNPATVPVSTEPASPTGPQANTQPILSNTTTLIVP